MTILSCSAVSPHMLTVQCDNCCPAVLATNDRQVLQASGWQLASGASRDLCPACRSEPRPAAIDRGRTPSSEHALPNLFIIGAAKCGTTSLHAYLDTHPDIAMAELKELRYFQDPDWRSWRNAYLEQFDPSAAIRGESSTMYTRAPAVPDVPARMAALAPQARLIYMVRDPVERAIASYIEERFQLLEPRPAEQAFNNLDDPYNPYVSASKYATQLSAYREHFPAEQIMVLPLSDLQDHPQRTMCRIFGFVGVDTAHTVDTSTRLNEGGAKYEYGNVAARLRRSAAGRLLRRLPARQRELLQGTVRRLLSRPLHQPDLPPSLEQRLRDVLASDAHEFRAMTGLAFADWSV